jgi:hypothetical protein
VNAAGVTLGGGGFGAQGRKGVERGQRLKNIKDTLTYIL